jgi:signal transduction histidine kinase
MELQLFRIVQEALTNVRKHAHAHHASIEVGPAAPDLLQVVVADDGIGLEPATVSGSAQRPLGLASMRERAESLGGTLQVQSRPGSGARVVVRVPMSEGVRP